MNFKFFSSCALLFLLLGCLSTCLQNTNSYSIQQLTQMLKNQGWDQLELIETQDKGYRENGIRTVGPLLM